jgi:hypothetical protein
LLHRRTDTQGGHLEKNGRQNYGWAEQVAVIGRQTMETKLRINMVSPLCVVVVSAGLIWGCGGGGGGTSASSTPGPGTAEAGASGNYLPMTVGIKWSYNIASVSGATGQGTVAVEAADTAPNAGQAALRVHEVLLDGGTLDWVQTSGSGVVRYEEQQLSQAGAIIVDKQYTPPILVLDESAAHLTSGATWTENYKELKTPSTKGKATKETAVWTVEAVGESVTVPAGTYTCIRVSRNHTTSQTPSTTVRWYAPGVGEVKETGAGQYNDQTLELSSVSMP